MAKLVADRHPEPSPARSRIAPALLALASVASATAGEPSPSGSISTADAGPWEVTRRSIAPAPGANRGWRVDYDLRNAGPSAVLLSAGSVAAEVDGWVSNSRVPSHGEPRPSRSTSDAPWGRPGFAEVVAAGSGADAGRCRELAHLEAWAEPSEAPPSESPPVAPAWFAGGLVPPVVVVPSGGRLRVRLTLEHEHFLYGPYEPLLGLRPLTLRVGPASIRDELPLDSAPPPAIPVASWPLAEPSPDRLSGEFFVSPPHSLHLDSRLPGRSLHRFSGPVRYGSRVRLSYWYLVAPGTEGAPKARVTQLKQGPSIWRTLHDGERTAYLDAAGRWQHVEEVFRTEPEATDLTLEFHLPGDVGELWVDDVVLEPLDEPIGGP